MVCALPLTFRRSRACACVCVQAAAAAAAVGGAVLAGQTQVASAETLYDKVSKLAAAVDALEKKAGGVGGVSEDDLKCAYG